MSASSIVQVCLSSSYPQALEQCGISYTTYLAVRRDHRFPPRNNLARRNMKLRQDVLDTARRHPDYTYREVAAALMISLPRVWKIFTDYMLHDEEVRRRIARTKVQLM